MRLHGTLTKWNDDRGFGFVTPAKGTPEVFVHISAFPREGGRPRLNELISFEIEAGPDGRQRAVRVMRPAQRRATPATPGSRREWNGRLGGAVALLILVAAGLYGYTQFAKRNASADRVGPDVAGQLASPSVRYVCDGRKVCSQMRSCDEARYFLRNCPGTTMDGDGDGEPCESQWCN